MEGDQRVRKTIWQYAAGCRFLIEVPALASPWAGTDTRHLLHDEEGRAKDISIALVEVPARRRHPGPFQATQDAELRAEVRQVAQERVSGVASQAKALFV